MTMLTLRNLNPEAFEDSETSELWPLFHENSKVGTYESHPSDSEVVLHMNKMDEVFEFSGLPFISLPERGHITMSLGEAMLARSSQAQQSFRHLEVSDLGTLLGFAAGVSRGAEETHAGRSFRTYPSAGALFPVEIYLISFDTLELPHSLYHYNALKQRLVSISPTVPITREQIASCLIQRELALQCSAFLLLAGIPERCTFKYGERGYRFMLMEAGHISQNLLLASTSLNLSAIPLGGFFDRDLDALLGFDGIAQSTLYLMGFRNGSEN